MASDSGEGDIFYDEQVLQARRQRSILVPIGAGATALVLAAGLCSFSLGRVGLSQQLMRARVVAQGATVAIMATTAAAGFGLYPSQAKE